MEKEKIKVWHNPEKNFFELFYKGELLPQLGKVLLNDNFTTEKGYITATAEFTNVDFIKEKPE